MERRTFLKTVAVTTPAVLAGCRSAPAEETQVDKLNEKVIDAMLTMQRASWEQGVAAQALLEYGRTEMVLLMAREAVLRQLDDGRLSVLYTDNGVTDPAASGEAVLYAAGVLRDARLKHAADKMLNFLLTTEHRTPSGILHHTMNSPEIWIDAMYMAPPFLARAGNFDESLKQIEGFREVLWNKEKKLYSHRWNDKKKIFINEKFWGVGNGWALSGISRVIDLLPDSYNEDRERLINYEKEHIDSCLAFMRDDGLFHNVIDDPDSFIETNLSQMLAYTIFSGYASGWLEEKYIPRAEKMRSAARAKVDSFGFVTGVCGAPYFNSPGRATEGQAFFILMEAARNRLIG